jgi:hypothetical protein
MFYGRRFAYFALPLGIAIPLSPFALTGDWTAMLNAEILASIAAYWLVPGLLVTGVALLVRRFTIGK